MCINTFHTEIVLLTPLTQKFMVGLNFSDRSEAAQFHKAVDAKVFERLEKRASKSKVIHIKVFTFT